MALIRLLIREARENRGMTQEDLAKRAGIRRATLSAIENGLTAGIDFATLESLADALGTTAGLLIQHDKAKRGGKT